MIYESLWIANSNVTLESKGLMNKAAESTLAGYSYNQDAKTHQRNTRHQFQGRSLLLLEAITGREKNPNLLLAGVKNIA